jgi:hypothetical protein
MVNYPTEVFSVSEYAELLGLTPRAIGKRIAGIAPAAHRQGRGGLTPIYSVSALPQDYQDRLAGLRTAVGAPSLTEILCARARPANQPGFALSQLPPASQAKAHKVRDVMAAYYDALDRGLRKHEANRVARIAHREIFGRDCNEKTIRRWVADVEAAGGFHLARIEVFADRKAVPHPRARLEHRMDIPAEFIKAFRALCCAEGMKHIMGAVRHFEIEWLAGREVPGLGARPSPDAPFPYTYAQLRKFAPSKPARDMGNLGKAHARANSLPSLRMSRAELRRAQRLILDDTRIDIIATDDLTGRPVELKGYFVADDGCMKIEGYVIREAGAIRAADVDALLARVLRSTGIAAPGAGYRTTIVFERGTVACSPARESLLRSLFPGRIEIVRTSMDGGPNFAGDYAQESSGHWMGKGPIESFMRTLGFFLQHIPGQRGSDYRRQPAHLALVGRDRATGRLKYKAGSQMHDGALLRQADEALALIADTGAELPANCTRANGRLKISSLYPVSWVLDRVHEAIAYYNQRTGHRLEGFRQIETQDESGRLVRRMESPNERAAWLEQFSATERIAPADMALLMMSSRAVVVRKNGVVLDCDPRKGLRFFSPHSVACQEASLLATGEKTFLALYDEEAIRRNIGPQEIYLCRKPDGDWQPGEPVRFIEHLPLAEAPSKADPAGLARALADSKRREQRAALELVTAKAPEIERRAADAEDNARLMRVEISRLGIDKPTSAPSGLTCDVIASRSEATTVAEIEEEESRTNQLLSAQDEYAAHLARIAQQAQEVKP